MNKLEVELPSDVPVAKARLLLALQLHKAGYVSRGRAAEIAGVSLSEYIQEMGLHDIPYFDYAPEELAQDLKNLQS